MKRTFTLVIVYEDTDAETREELRDSLINKIEFGSLTAPNVAYSLAPLSAEAVELPRCKLCGHNSFSGQERCDYCEAPKDKSYTLVVEEECLLCYGSGYRFSSPGFCSCERGTTLQ